METPPEIEPINAEELVYRRIPKSQDWYDPVNGVSPNAFGPTKWDTDGISLTRAKFKTISEAAHGQAGKQYYIAILKVRDLFANHINVVASPIPENLGHAEIPDITYALKNSIEVLEKKVVLKKLVIEVRGPFPL